MTRRRFVTNGVLLGLVLASVMFLIYIKVIYIKKYGEWSEFMQARLQMMQAEGNGKMLQEFLQDNYV